MGKRLDNWLSKASSNSTRVQWKSRWLKFAKWVTSAENPLTGKPHLDCNIEEIDDVIRNDFESMPSHLFHDKYRDILTKYVASLSTIKSNTAISWISSIRSFFSHETMSIKLQGVPKKEIAMGEHRFTLTEFQRMWLIADTEGKARLSVAVSLGWGIGDFLALTTPFIKEVLQQIDDEGFTAFDYRRKKTRARIRGILTPNAIEDLKNYLQRIPDNQDDLWTTKTTVGFNYWLRSLCKEAGISENGTIRFHLIRKYVYDIVSSRCGVYEAKLLVGKGIPLTDATYLHGLQDRLLERYKKYAYPLLQLNHMQSERESQEALEKKLRTELDTKSDKLQTLINGLVSENLELKNEIHRIDANSQERNKEHHILTRRLFEENSDLTARMNFLSSEVKYLTSSEYATRIVEANLANIVNQVLQAMDDLTS